MRTFAPGRVNLIGDHTDYTGGLVLPMAIGMGTTVTGRRGGDEVVIESGQREGAIRLGLPFTVDPAVVKPAWGRYVAGVVSVLQPVVGFTGRIESDLPLGAGLSSSASLELAVALSLGATTEPKALAALCQEAEHRASGVPCGIMDQLASAAGQEGRALLIDCRSLDVEPIPVPDDAVFIVCHSGESRELAGSAYATRKAECERAEAVIGPLRSARPDDADRIEDPVVRARARHVTSENDRVRRFAAALRNDQLDVCGRLMKESHASLAADFEVSTPILDGLVADLNRTDGVYGARLTGAGLGGCVVALCRPGTDIGGWVVRPSAGAHVVAD